MMLVVLYIFVSISLVILTNLEARNIIVDVRASWLEGITNKDGKLLSIPEGLSYIAQVAEYTNDYSKEAFWQFLDNVCNESKSKIDQLLATVQSNDNVNNDNDAEEIKAWTLEAVTGILPSSMINLAMTELGLGAYVPAITFYQVLSEEYGDPCQGQAFIVSGGKVSCDYDSNSIVKDDIQNKQFGSWDHVYTSTMTISESARIVYLYGQIGSSSFCRLNSVLQNEANNGNIRYVMRHAFPSASSSSLLSSLSSSSSSSKHRLQGYGVFLDIKNMEYKNIDDRKSNDENSGAAKFSEGEQKGGFIFSTLLNRRPDLATEFDMLRTEMDLLVTKDPSSEMKVWKMKDLGLQATQAVVSSSSSSSSAAIKIWTDIVQNFPNHASSLSSIKVDPKLRSAVSEIWSEGLSLPSNCVLVSGLRINLEANSFNIFDFLKTVRSEIISSSSLSSLRLGSSFEKSIKQLSISLGMEDRGSQIIRIDVSKGCKHVLAFVNNLEKDRMYSTWPKTLRQLAYPSWSLVTIARNLYTLIANPDITTRSGMMLLYEIYSFYKQMYPVRFGIVPVCFHNDIKTNIIVGDMCRLFAGLKIAHGDQYATQLLFNLAQDKLESETDEVSLTQKDLINAYASVSSLKRGLSPNTLAKEATEILANGSYSEFISNSTAYLTARGLTPNTFSFNGIVSSNNLGQFLMSTLGREQFLLMQFFTDRIISDRTKSIFSEILKNAKAYARYHPLLDEKPVFLDFNQKDELALLNACTTQYISNSKDGKDDINVSNTTFLIYTPNRNGYESVVNALNFLKATDGNHRLCLLLNLLPSSILSSSETCADNVCPNTNTNKEIEYISTIDGSDVEALLKGFEYLLSSEFENSKSLGIDSSKVDTSSIIKSYSNLKAVFPDLSTEQIFVYNGRKVKSEVSFHELDFELVSGLEENRLGTALRKLLDSSSVAVSSDIILRIMSFIGSYSSSSSSHRYDFTRVFENNAMLSSLLLDIDPYTSTGAADADSNDVELIYILDPLSLASQRAASLISLVQEHVKIKQRVVFIPRMEISEFPLQNFYRFVWTNYDKAKAVAAFRGLPRQHTLTVRIDSPEPWNIQASNASQDIDNLRCDDSICGDTSSSDVTEVTYGLKNLLAAGHCFEMKRGAIQQVPPNGLQLILSDPSSSNSSSIRSDTLVMQNLGYFQLQASPGLWRLGLAQGRASELFSIKDADPDTGDIQIAVKSFADISNKLYVTKNKGYESVPLLEDANANDDDNSSSSKGKGKGKAKSAWGSITSMFTSKEKIVSSSNETIHIFSLATGHMYERLLRIMMLSVIKKTKNPVKFWLFENYLSPTFKDSASIMSKHYGFEVGYVTYKWPAWLTQQTQKQRIIWGYKILFLDVLFPLEVKKVIYVDADQVVRADLKELWDLDLEGKPYGYTPFCDSRNDTLGFQFWRHGYWEQHLRGKPYHISALYVVDLTVFRRYAVGDQLRAVYDGLARDPNSLANLDQDLPNYAQHSVPIFSLPQEWLWCESWCSDDSKENSKTIDLCNNPRYKEPKLDMARRVISGPLFTQSWVELDDEISKMVGSLGQ